jgi:hypothetical protein
MTPAEWNEAMSKPWQTAYAAVERAARKYLHAMNDDEYLTTAELVEELYPERFARGDGITARRRIFKALLATRNKTGEPAMLADCRERGPEQPRRGTRGQMIRPWHWFKPGNEGAAFKPDDTPPRVCPHCGGLVF